MASPQIVNINGAFGYDTFPTASDGSKGAVLREFVFATTASAGELVSLSTDGYKIIRTLTNTAARLTVGVAVENVAAAASGLVCLYGPAYGVKKEASAITAGDLVTVSASTTGGVVSLAQTTAITQLKDTAITIGVAMKSATAGDTTVSVFVAKQ